MNVLSLFDGMSGGQIALNKVGIKYENYFASEIKKHAIETTQINYPNTIQLGDVTKIKASDLPKIDLLIGGSPCQDFSQRNSKRDGLNGQKSNLFFEYLRLLIECEPKYFLLENVMMFPEHFALLSNYLQIYPVKINGSLVSGAMRRRLFWTNIKYYADLHGFKHTAIPQPKDKKIYLQDILTDGYVNKRKANCLATHNGFVIKENYEENMRNVNKRIINAGFDNVVFSSPDFDVKKGIRFFNQIELERLHNIPENYTQNLTVKKAHDLIGDGWTVDVIAHIFSFIS